MENERLCADEHNTLRERAQPTRIERHVLERCPDCNYRLSGASIAYAREVIELPLPQPVTCGEPASAWRKARCKVVSDQVAVPSRLRSGVRRACLRIRSRSALP